jgi:hypothetical protein
VSDIDPCPWCTDGGNPFLHRNYEPFHSYTVQCKKCFAQGPHVKFTPSEYRKTWEQVSVPAKEKAISRWNERMVASNTIDVDLLLSSAVLTPRIIRPIF